MYRYEVEWLVPGGGVGLSRFHAQPAAATQANRQAWVDGIRTFFNAIASQLPPAVSLSFASEITDMNAVDASVAGFFAVTAPASVVGSSTSSEFAAAAGAMVRWNTDAVSQNRRVRGRTFLVPVTRGAYDAQGTIQAGSITQIQTAASAYVAATQSGAVIPHVFSPPKPGRAGFVSAIVSASVPDKAVILRSRRD